MAEFPEMMLLYMFTVDLSMYIPPPFEELYILFFMVLFLIVTTEELVIETPPLLLEMSFPIISAVELSMDIPRPELPEMVLFEISNLPVLFEREIEFKVQLFRAPDSVELLMEMDFNFRN